MFVRRPLGEARFDEGGDEIAHAVFRNAKGLLDLERAQRSEAREQPVEQRRARGRTQDGHRLMHFAHARMGCIELVAQPLRSFAGGLGRDNGALAGPELGSERLGAHGSGQGQRPGRWRAPRDQGAGEEIERPQRRGRPRLLEGDRPGGQGEQLVAALGGREMRRGGRGPMQAIERGEGPVVRAIVGGRLGGLCCKLIRFSVICLAESEGGAMSGFKGRHFEGEIVLWAVRWYCRYGISYRDLEQMMGERGVNVDHSTIYRWVQRYAPEIEKRLRWQWRRPASTSWRVDETYIKVRGAWTYLYRAVDKDGNTIDFYLSPTRNTKAAKRFLGKALGGLKDWEKPEIINTDKAPTYTAAIAELKAEGKCPKDTQHRQVKYLNNVVEADHGKLKQLIRPVRGFKTLKTAYATIKGFEVMRALRKGQAAAFNLTRDICGEARLVERAFGLGACALTEAIQLIGKRMELEAA